MISNITKIAEKMFEESCRRLTTKAEDKLCKIMDEKKGMFIQSIVNAVVSGLGEDPNISNGLYDKIIESIKANIEKMDLNIKTLKKIKIDNSSNELNDMSLNQQGGLPNLASMAKGQLSKQLSKHKSDVLNNLSNNTQSQLSKQLSNLSSNPTTDAKNIMANQALVLSSAMNPENMNKALDSAKGVVDNVANKLEQAIEVKVISIIEDEKEQLLDRLITILLTKFDEDEKFTQHLLSQITDVAMKKMVEDIELKTSMENSNDLSGGNKIKKTNRRIKQQSHRTKQLYVRYKRSRKNVPNKKKYTKNTRKKHAVTKN